MKLLLLGKNGMLARAILQTFHKKDPEGSSFRIIAWGHEELDITNKKIVHDKIVELRPKTVINAIGYTNVDGAETERKIAFAVNAEGVGYLAQACAEIGASLFHFSTDYIFDGTQTIGYKEDDTKHISPLNVYGESKLQGEKNVKCQPRKLSGSNVKYFIIRTSWLYGAGGKNFVDTMLSLAKSGKTELKVVNDQFGKPTYTMNLAERVLWMIERLENLKSGIYHCVNEVNSKPQLKTKNLSTNSVAGISWHTFAREIFKQASKRGIIKSIPAVIPCQTAEFPRPAKRPANSALINTKLPPMPEWKEALRGYLTYKLSEPQEHL